MAPAPVTLGQGLMAAADGGDHRGVADGVCGATWSTLFQPAQARPRGRDRYDKLADSYRA